MILSVLTVGFPFLGMRTTVTVHVPLRIPRTVLPTNVQYFVPRVMEIRMEPCERFGIFSETVAAIFAAVALRYARIRNVLSDVVLLVLRAMGCTVVEVLVLLAIVVPTRSVVELLELEELLLEEAVDVVVGNALRESTVTGVLPPTWVLLPSCPRLFAPQHFTSPSGVSAHVCEPPATMSTAPLDKPCTAADAGSGAAAEVLRPN